MQRILLAAAFLLAPMSAGAQSPAPGSVSISAHWYSEEVAVAGALYKPAGMNATAKLPGVVLAPGWGETAASLNAYATALAAQGIIALTIDYRGWGKSAGEIYLGERLSFYDAQRFTDQTVALAVRRGRLDPGRQHAEIRRRAKWAGPALHLAIADGAGDGGLVGLRAGGPSRSVAGGAVDNTPSTAASRTTPTRGGRDRD